LALVQVSDGTAGVVLGNIGISTAELLFVNEGNLHEDWNTGSGEGGLDNQGLFADFGDSSILQIASQEHTESFGVGFLNTAFFSDVTTGLSQGEDQQNYSTLQHESSVNSSSQPYSDIADWSRNEEECSG
jgi:hypothetical protein